MENGNFKDLDGGPRVGVVGVGYLGRVLAARLASHRQVLVTDKVPSRARDLAAQTPVAAVDPEELFRTAKIVVLVIPPAEVIPLLRKQGNRLQPGAVVVNMASSLATREVALILAHREVEVVGLKLLGQAYALSLGLKVLFLYCYGGNGLHPLVADLFSPLGEVVPGDEKTVEVVNDLSTRFGLAMYLQLERQLEEYQLTPEMKEVAIKAVAVGTILDFPPRAENDYISKRLDQVRRQCRHWRL
jgi:pyrroline-5-carboxylate reductase